MQKSKILLKVTGSIAAYKACYLSSKLVQADYDVKVVMSKSAMEFVGTTTFEGLTGNKVHADIFEPGEAMEHIHLMRWADLIITAPATAAFINRAAAGIAEDLLGTLFLAHDFQKPYLIAPAMNTSMYLHPSTQNSLKKLKDYGIQILETASGVLACGENGWGKLLDPDLIFQEIESTLKNVPNKTIALNNKKSATPVKKILVTSGGTRESLDKVRAITNFSTGNTGAQLVDQLISLGFEVTHLLGTSSAASAADCRRIFFTDYHSISEALKNLMSQELFDGIVHLAAISDYQIDKITSNNNSHISSNKISLDEPLQIHLKPTPKLLPQLKTWSLNKDLKVIGFKLTSEADLATIKSAVKKVLDQGNIDFLVHNDLSAIDLENHPYTIYDKKGTELLFGKNKHSLIKSLIQVLIEGDSK